MEQDPREFEWLKQKVAGAASILEIGCRYGDSLAALAAVAKPGALIRAIDHGMPSGECPYPTKDQLRETIRILREHGYDAAAMFADSHDPETLDWARQWAPYDFVYVDADHRYEGVKQDWEWYGPLARRIGFHDIAFVADGMGVHQLWKEIGAAGYATQEAVYTGMGTGIVARPEHAAAVATAA
jgi:hypothetical protein